MPGSSFNLEVQTIQATYRSPRRADYPEISTYTREKIYDETIGGGALYLAAKMTRTLHLQPSDVGLDLGLPGATSIFLARQFGVKVVAVELWASATCLNQKFTARGYRDKVEISIAQLAYARDQRPAKSLFSLTAVKL